MAAPVALRFIPRLPLLKVLLTPGVRGVVVGVSFSACLFSSDVEDALFLRNESGVSRTECFVMASLAFLCPVN